jgi:hypothetical protein
MLLEDCPTGARSGCAGLRPLTVVALPDDEEEAEHEDGPAEAHDVEGSQAPTDPVDHAAVLGAAHRLLHPQEPRLVAVSPSGRHNVATYRAASLGSPELPPPPSVRGLGCA